MKLATFASYGGPVAITPLSISAPGFQRTTHRSPCGNGQSAEAVATPSLAFGRISYAAPLLEFITRHLRLRDGSRGRWISYVLSCQLPHAATSGGSLNSLTT